MDKLTPAAEKFSISSATASKSLGAPADPGGNLPGLVLFPQRRRGITCALARAPSSPNPARPGASAWSNSRSAAHRLVAAGSLHPGGGKRPGPLALDAHLSPAGRLS